VSAPDFKDCDCDGVGMCSAHVDEMLAAHPLPEPYEWTEVKQYIWKGPDGYYFEDESNGLVGNGPFTTVEEADKQLTGYCDWLMNGPPHGADEEEDDFDLDEFEEDELEDVEEDEYGYDVVEIVKPRAPVFDRLLKGITVVGWIFVLSVALTALVRMALG
jgi:hypothetical protein